MEHKKMTDTTKAPDLKPCPFCRYDPQQMRDRVREEALREALAECDSIDPTHARIEALITKDQANG
jgi:hypothetical protein